MGRKSETVARAGVFAGRRFPAAKNLPSPGSRERRKEASYRIGGQRSQLRSNPAAEELIEAGIARGDILIKANMVFLNKGANQKPRDRRIEKTPGRTGEARSCQRAQHKPSGHCPI